MKLFEYYDYLLSDGNRNFAYDDENQLVSVWVTNQWREDFVYDGMMRRRITKQYTWNGSAWQETNEIHYIYDGNTVVQERDAINLPMVTYTRGNDLSGTLQGAGGIGGLLARTVNADLLSPTTQPEASSYYHSDGNGNITMLIDTNQNVVARYLYGPYGNLLGMWGPLAAANVYRFSSKAWDENAGIYYYGYRFYDPNLQRWLNRDPIQEWGGINLYRFVANNPINLVDLFGLAGDSEERPGGEPPVWAETRQHAWAAMLETYNEEHDSNNPNNPNANNAYGPNWPMDDTPAQWAWDTLPGGPLGWTDPNKYYIGPPRPPNAKPKPTPCPSKATTPTVLWYPILI